MNQEERIKGIQTQFESEFHEKKLRNDIIFKIFLAVIITLAFALFLYILFTKSVECHNNPFVYGANEFSKKYGGDVHCFCNIESERGLVFSFSNKEFDGSQDQMPDIEFGEN